MRHLTCVLIALISVTACSQSSSPGFKQHTRFSLPLDSDDIGAIRGIVVDSRTHLPIQYANILAVGTGRGTYSDEEGRFKISDLEAGTYTIKVLSMGWISRTIEGVVVKPGKYTDVRIELEIHPPTMKETPRP